jgi:hypothetical protein
MRPANDRAHRGRSRYRPHACARRRRACSTGKAAAVAVHALAVEAAACGPTGATVGRLRVRARARMQGSSRGSVASRISPTVGAGRGAARCRSTRLCRPLQSLGSSHDIGGQQAPALRKGALRRRATRPPLRSKTNQQSRWGSLAKAHGAVACSRPIHNSGLTTPRPFGCPSLESAPRPLSRGA